MHRLIFLLLIANTANAQYKDYMLTTKGDTINRIDKNELKQGKWIVRVEDNMGEPGTQEEGSYKDGEKHGPWKIYSLYGDPLGEENWINGGKNGKQMYFDMHGNLLREENWKTRPLDQQYDTVWVPDWKKDPTGQTNKKVVVKNELNSIKNGTWKWFDEKGKLVRSEIYKADRLEESTLIDYDYVTGKIQKKEITKYDIMTGKPVAKAVTDRPKTAAKPKQVEEFENIKKGKKRKYQDGSTG
jgi:hypothetical protein